MARFVKAAGPETRGKRENSLPSHRYNGVEQQSFASVKPGTYIVHHAAQERERRPGGIQIAKPTAQSGWIGHSIRIFDRRGGILQCVTFHEVPTESLAAGNQAVVAIGRGKKAART